MHEVIHRPVEELEDEIERLKLEQAGIQEQLSALRDAVIRRSENERERKTLLQRLANAEGVARHAAARVDQMLESRIWRTLQTLGGVVLRMGLLGRVNGDHPMAGWEKREVIQLRCDTLAEEPEEAFSGDVGITGWALSPDGIEEVEFQIDGEPPMPAKYGLRRSDVAKAFPHAPGADHSGYQMDIDTGKLPNGLHWVKIRARTKGGQEREIERPFLIDQGAAGSMGYSRWLLANEMREPEIVRLRISVLSYRPVISVLVPVFRTGLEILRQTVESVRAQSYDRWELCLVNDGSGDPELTQLLADYSAADPRIRVAERQERGGISAASNEGLAMATGEYVALLDHDDVLAEDALFHVVEALQREPRPDLLYSDEDHMDERGRRFAPFFKPDWSPDLILSENYVCHLMCFERQLAIDAGGFRSEFDISQDHDLLLRLSRRTQSIVHIPRVLYHWRTSIDSMARASTLEDRAFRSSRGVIEAHLAEAGVAASVCDGLHPGRWRVQYPIPAGTRVSILIPTAGKIDVLERNLKALWKTAGGTPYEIVIIDNCKGVNNTTIEQYVEKLRHEGRPVRRFDQRNQPFNYPALNNGAAATCESELLLFLNDDTEGIADGWLDALAEHAVRPEVGAVGAKLLYPDGTIQHAGVTMGLAEICGHSFKNLKGVERHYYDFPDLIRNVSAVTAACVMVRADVFREVDGFDEKAFPIAYNDIDLCLRIGKAGYRIIYTPHALLYHHEAYSKSDKELNPHPMETMALKTRWKEVIARDPYYNPNLTREKENWSLRWD